MVLSCDAGDGKVLMREYSGEFQYQVVWQMGKSCLRLYSQLSYELLKFRESVCDLRVWHETNDS